MEALALLYRRYRQRISLKRFMRVVDPPYWRLRDYLRAGKVREQRLHARSRAAATVEAVAATETTSGYRRLYPHLRQQGMRIGREWIRRVMGERGLQPPPPVKKKRSPLSVVVARDRPDCCSRFAREIVLLRAMIDRSCPIPAGSSLPFASRITVSGTPTLFPFLPLMRTPALDDVVTPKSKTVSDVITVMTIVL